MNVEHVVQSTPCLIMLSVLLRPYFLFLESVRRKIRRKVKWRSLNKVKPPRTSPARRAAAKAQVALKVTAARVKVAAMTVAVRRSLEPTAVALVTTSLDDSKLIQYNTCLCNGVELTACSHQNDINRREWPGFRQFSSNVQCLYFRGENSLSFSSEMRPRF